MMAIGLGPFSGSIPAGTFPDRSLGGAVPSTYEAWRLMRLAHPYSDKTRLSPKSASSDGTALNELHDNPCRASSASTLLCSCMDWGIYAASDKKTNCYQSAYLGQLILGTPVVPEGIVAAKRYAFIIVLTDT